MERNWQQDENLHQQRAGIGAQHNWFYDCLFVCHETQVCDATTVETVSMSMSIPCRKLGYYRLGVQNIVAVDDSAFR